MNETKTIMNTNNKIYELIEKCKESVVKEYDKFKENMLNSDTQKVFDNAYRVSSYTDLLYYFENNGFSCNIQNYFKDTSDNINNIDKLENFSNKHILFELYENHFNYESLYLVTWEDIDVLVENVIFEI